MRTALIIWLFLVIHAENQETSTTYSFLPPPLSPLYVHDELKKIHDFCLTPEDYDELKGIPNFNGIDNVYPSIVTIGFREMREALNLPSLPKLLNKTLPSEEEIESTKDNKERLVLIEQANRTQFTEISGFNEENMIHLIDFFDKRVPSTRQLFRHMFTTILRYDPELSERDTSSSMMEYFEERHRSMASGFYGPGFDGLQCGKEKNKNTNIGLLLMKMSWIFPFSLMMFTTKLESLTNHESCYIGNKDFFINLFTYKLPNGTLISSVEPTLDAIAIHEFRAVMNMTSPKVRNSYNATLEELGIDDDPFTNFQVIHRNMLLWVHYQPTLEAYNTFNEPDSVIRNLDIEYFYKNNLIPFENNLESSVAYFDKTFPVIRKIFRARFQEVRDSAEASKEMIGYEILKFHETITMISETLRQCLSKV